MKNSPAPLDLFFRAMAGATYGDLGTWDYAYDSGGNVLTAAQASTLGVYLRQDAEHDYDTADRLLTTEYTDFQQWGPTNYSNSSWYSYDDLGNRISHKYRTASAIGYEHDKANRMTKIDTLTQGYDAAGNVTTAYSADRGTSYKYHYDHHNRMTAVYDSSDTTRLAAFTWDALGRRIEYASDVRDSVTEYWYDGVNEIDEKTTHNPAGSPFYSLRYYIHGVSYVDERLLMRTSTRPYYYVVDRMYNVRAILDRAGSIVERYAYDSYGRPLIRESCGRGDIEPLTRRATSSPAAKRANAKAFANASRVNQDTKMSSADTSRFDDALNANIWDPRADLNDDGSVTAADETAYNNKYSDWSGANPPVTVAQAVSDVGNPFMFQGVPHFALDTQAAATSGKLLLNHHRARFADPVTGRWVTRDPLFANTTTVSHDLIYTYSLQILSDFWYNESLANNYSGATRRGLSRHEFVTPANYYDLLDTQPTGTVDPMGLSGCDEHCRNAAEEARSQCIRDHAGDPEASCACLGVRTVTFNDCVRNINAGCPTAPPAPPGPTCNVYPPNATYLGANLRCFCNCAGTSPWSNAVRGCLACYQQQGCPTSNSHSVCYKKADQANYPGGRPWSTLAYCWLSCQ